MTPDSVMCKHCDAVFYPLETRHECAGPAEKRIRALEDAVLALLGPTIWTPDEPGEPLQVHPAVSRAMLSDAVEKARST